MVSIVVRMVAADLAFLLGVLLLMRPGDATKLVSPLHLLGAVMAAAGLAGSIWLSLALVRFSRERRHQGPSLAGDDGRPGDGFDRRER